MPRPLHGCRVLGLVVGGLGGCDPAAPPAGAPPATDPPPPPRVGVEAPPAPPEAGPHTEAVTAPCTLFVAPEGRDGRDGRGADRAVRTPARAVALAAPGDVVCFAAGTYRPLVVAGVHATADAPLVLRAAPGATHAATLTTGRPDRGLALGLSDVAHVHVEGLRLARSRRGLSCTACDHVRIAGLLVEELGQAGIHVGRDQRDDEGGVPGPPSHHVDVVGNTIRDTGRVVARYGEGVYVGTGGSEGDETHHVLVADNHISDTRAEGVDVKPWTHDVVVRGNTVVGGSHFFHGAIAIGAQAFAAPPGHCVVEGNRVHGYRATEGGSVAGIAIGHGDTVVRDNVVWDIEGGRGIRVLTTFAGPGGRAVRLEGNTVWTPGEGPGIALHDGSERTGMVDGLAQVTLVDNRTDDGSAGSTRLREADLVGPLAGAADGGEGPGSGLSLRAPPGPPAE